MEKQQLKTLIVILTNEAHKRVKNAATNQGMTISRYVREAIAFRLKNEQVFGGKPVSD